MKASGIRTVIYTVHIGSHYILVMLHLTVEKAALRPWYASIGNKNVEAAIELCHDLIDYFFDVLLASDIYLVSSA